MKNQNFTLFVVPAMHMLLASGHKAHVQASAVNHPEPPPPQPSGRGVH